MAAEGEVFTMHGGAFVCIFTCSGAPGEHDLCIFTCSGARGELDLCIFTWSSAPGEHYLCIFTCSSASLGLSGALWGSHGASWGVVGLLGPPGAFWGILGLPGAFWGFLGSPGASITLPPLILKIYRKSSNLGDDPRAYIPAGEPSVSSDFPSVFPKKSKKPKWVLRK